MIGFGITGTEATYSTKRVLDFLLFKCASILLDILYYIMSNYTIYTKPEVCNISKLVWILLATHIWLLNILA
jgi:hypothetical protein